MRRWLPLSLLLTVAVGWTLLAPNVNAVSHRKTLMVWMAEHGAMFNQDTAADSESLNRIVQTEQPTILRLPNGNGPGWLNLNLGDRAIECIMIPGIWREQPQVSQIDRAFPEAKITIGGDR